MENSAVVVDEKEEEDDYDIPISNEDSEKIDQAVHRASYTATLDLITKTARMEVVLSDVEDKNKEPYQQQPFKPRINIIRRSIHEVKNTAATSTNVSSAATTIVSITADAPFSDTTHQQSSYTIDVGEEEQVGEALEFMSQASSSGDGNDDIIDLMVVDSVVTDTAKLVGNDVYDNANFIQLFGGGSCKDVEDIDVHAPQTFSQAFSKARVPEDVLIGEDSLQLLSSQSASASSPPPHNLNSSFEVQQEGDGMAISETVHADESVEVSAVVQDVEAGGDIDSPETVYSTQAPASSQQEEQRAASPRVILDLTVARETEETKEYKEQESITAESPVVDYATQAPSSQVLDHHSHASSPLVMNLAIVQEGGEDNDPEYATQAPSSQVVDHHRHASSPVAVVSQKILSPIISHISDSLVVGGEESVDLVEAMIVVSTDSPVHYASQAPGILSQEEDEEPNVAVEIIATPFDPEEDSDDDKNMDGVVSQALSGLYAYLGEEENEEKSEQEYHRREKEHSVQQMMLVEEEEKSQDEDHIEGNILATLAVNRPVIALSAEPSNHTTSFNGVIYDDRISDNTSHPLIKETSPTLAFSLPILFPSSANEDKEVTEMGKVMVVETKRDQDLETMDMDSVIDLCHQSETEMESHQRPHLPPPPFQPLSSLHVTSATTQTSRRDLTLKSSWKRSVRVEILSNPLGVSLSQLSQRQQSQRAREDEKS